MRQHRRRTEGCVGNQARGNPVNLLLFGRRPNLRAKKAEASLYEPVIEVCENDIIASLYRVRIESDRSFDVGVGVFKTLAALLPAGIDELSNGNRTRDARE